MQPTESAQSESVWDWLENLCDSGKYDFPPEEIVDIAMKLTDMLGIKKNNIVDKLHARAGMSNYTKIFKYLKYISKSVAQLSAGKVESSYFRINGCSGKTSSKIVFRGKINEALAKYRYITNNDPRLNDNDRQILEQYLFKETEAYEHLKKYY